MQEAQGAGAADANANAEAEADADAKDVSEEADAPPEASADDAPIDESAGDPDPEPEPEQPDVGSLTVAALKAELEKRDLPTNGRKADLIQRLQEAQVLPPPTCLRIPTCAVEDCKQCTHMNVCID